MRDLLDAGADFIVTTAGMSVDPDDLTRKGLTEAGLTDTLYGVPALPGTMTLIGRIGGAQIIGVPACALFFKTTVFDIILPRMLAGVPITRLDLAKIGNGGLCMECKVCTFPKCPSGKSDIRPKSMKGSLSSESASFLCEQSVGVAAVAVQIRVAEFRLFLEVHHGVARIVQRVIAAEQDAILRMLVEDGLEKIGLDERGTA